MPREQQLMLLMKEDCIIVNISRHDLKEFHESRGVKSEGNRCALRKYNTVVKYKRMQKVW